MRQAPLLIFHKIHHRLLRQMLVEHLARQIAARPFLPEIGDIGYCFLDFAMNELSETLALGSRRVRVHRVMRRTVICNVQRDVGTCSTEYLGRLIKTATDNAQNREYLRAIPYISPYFKN